MDTVKQYQAEVLNVALFEKRHKWPGYVTEFLYEDRSAGYDPRDFSTFEGLALIKMAGWKSKGVKAINLYLSGLVGATIAALNVAYSLGLYVKLFHYSNLTNKWIAQTLDFLPVPSGIIFRTVDELEAEREEDAIKAQISERERKTIVGYVNVFNKLQEHYNPDLFTWEDVYSYITREYRGYDKNCVMLMKPYFCKKKGDKPESETYNERIRRYLEEQRGKEQPKQIFKSTDFRRTRRRHY